MPWRQYTMSLQEANGTFKLSSIAFSFRLTGNFSLLNHLIWPYVKKTFLYFTSELFLRSICDPRPRSS